MADFEAMVQQEMEKLRIQLGWKPAPTSSSAASLDAVAPSRGLSQFAPDSVPVSLTGDVRAATVERTRETDSNDLSAFHIAEAVDSAPLARRSIDAQVPYSKPPGKWGEVIGLFIFVFGEEVRLTFVG